MAVGPPTQSKAVNNNGAGATVAQAHTSTPQSGAAIIVITGLGAQSGAVTCAVTGTGLTFVQDAYLQNNDQNVWVHRATSVGTNPTITSTVSSGQWLAQILIEQRGLAASPFDKSASGTGTSNAPLTGATATLSQADEIVYGAMTNNSGANPETVNAGSGYTNLNNSLNGGVQIVAGEYKVVAATTAVTASFSLGDGPQWAIVCITYKGAAAGAATSLPPPRQSMQHLLVR